MNQNCSTVTFDDVVKLIEDMSKPTPRDYRVFIPPCLLEEARKQYPSVQWTPTYEKVK